MIGEYEVISDLHVPTGLAKANSGIVNGNGNGQQHFIHTYKESLKLVREIPLNQ